MLRPRQCYLKIHNSFSSTKNHLSIFVRLKISLMLKPTRRARPEVAVAILVFIFVYFAWFTVETDLRQPF